MGSPQFTVVLPTVSVGEVSAIAAGAAWLGIKYSADAKLPAK